MEDNLKQEDPNSSTTAVSELISFLLLLRARK